MIALILKYHLTANHGLKKNLGTNMVLEITNHIRRTFHDIEELSVLENV